MAMWERWTGALFGLVLWLVTGGGEVQAGQFLRFTKESFPDSQADYAACGRPRPSWVCDPGHFLTEKQGDVVDANINGNGGQGMSGTIQIMVLPRLLGTYGNVTTGEEARDQFTDYQYAKTKSVNGTSVNLIVYFVDTNGVSLRVGTNAVSGECFCQLSYESKQYISRTGFPTLLDIYSSKFRNLLKGTEKCSASSENVPWMVDSRGRCTWTKLILSKKITPTSGPPQGGTLVQINGNNLDISQGDVLIGTLRCKVLTRSSTLLTFRTVPLDNIQTANSALTVYLLLGTRKFNTGLRFTYSGITTTTMLPTTSTMSRAITIKTIWPTTVTISGGLKLTVEGRNLDLVKDAFLWTKVVGMNPRIREADYKTTCETANSTYMYCVTPKLEMDIFTGASNRRRKGRELMRWREVARDRRQVARQRRRAGLEGESGEGLSQSVDDVNITVTLEVNGNILSLDDYDARSVPFKCFEDPELFAFEGHRRTFIPVWPRSERQIEIKGTGLLPALKGHNVVVKIGDGTCVAKEMYTNLLVCSPPLTEPKAAGSDPAVKTSIGYLKFNIGFLEYQDNLWKYPPIRYATIAGIGVVVVSVVGVTICLACFLRKHA